MRRPSLHAVLAAALLATGLPAAQADAPNPYYAAGTEAAGELRYAAALAHFQQAAAAGDRDALRTSGLMLLYGEALYGPAIRQDRARAQELLRQAAAQGCEVSIFMLRQLEMRRRG